MPRADGCLPGRVQEAPPGRRPTPQMSLLHPSLRGSWSGCPPAVSAVWTTCPGLEPVFTSLSGPEAQVQCGDSVSALRPAGRPWSRTDSREVPPPQQHDHIKRVKLKPSGRFLKLLSLSSKRAGSHWAVRRGAEKHISALLIPPSELLPAGGTRGAGSLPWTWSCFLRQGVPV